jgi:hypothetical protein
MVEARKEAKSEAIDEGRKEKTVRASSRIDFDLKQPCAPSARRCARDAVK